MSVERALFLSGSFGKGHDTLAEACAGALDRCGVKSTIVDCMPMLGKGPGRAGDWVFKRLLSVDAVYDGFHFSQLRGDGPVGRFMDRAAVRVMFPQLEAEIDRADPQLVVSVFATGASAAVGLKGRRPSLFLAVFITDAFAHRMWVHEGTDLFLVTSELTAASVRRYWPAAPVRVVNAPVRAPFYAAPPQGVARAAFGVPHDATCVLVMSGAWGIGALDEAAAALADAGHWVLAVCGTNARLLARLREVATGRPRVVSLGYTDRVAELMSAADVVVTSSGDTCREARVVGRRLVLLDVVPGHGRENLMHELELGGAAVCSTAPASVVGTVELMLRSAPPPAPSISAEAWDRSLLDVLRESGVPLDAV